MRQILIRADDLGFSEGVNYGIAKAMIDLLSFLSNKVNLCILK